jgi:ferric-dicitrate binding protein FerR (iron transport regulator)
MLSQNEIERIERYIVGTADKEDMVFVEELFSQGHHHHGLRNKLEKEWEDNQQYVTVSGEKLNHMLDRVHHMIRNKENRKRKLFIHRFTHVYSKVAAILLLPLMIAGSLAIGYLVKPIPIATEQPVTSVIHAPMGARVSFNLPDGTKGWLNSGSSLTYSIPFNNNRNVALVGEAWFDVCHNEKSPFEVSAGTSKVRVLGTSFNVSAYLGAKYIEVVLKNGKVEFYAELNSHKVMIAPSQKLVYCQNAVKLSDTDPSKYSAWTDGKLVFRGDNMLEVAGRIGRWYNVKVILADKDLEKFSFRATFEDDSLEEVLRLLSLTSPINYRITARVLNSDGTYEKQIVTLYKRANNKSNNPKMR